MAHFPTSGAISPEQLVHMPQLEVDAQHLFGCGIKASRCGGGGAATRVRGRAALPAATSAACAMASGRDRNDGAYRKPGGNGPGGRTGQQSDGGLALGSA